MTIAGHDGRQSSAAPGCALFENQPLQKLSQRPGDSRKPFFRKIRKSMREAVVVASSRTPLAKSFRGSFNLTRPDDLLAHCLTHVLEKAPQLDPAEIEDL